MQPGGNKVFDDYCKITMVHADGCSTCSGPQGIQMLGGQACGFIINIPHHNLTIYHAGDT